MSRRKGVPWTTQATSHPLADFEAITLLGRKSIGDFEVIIDPELENGEVIMANTRKPVKPKAGASEKVIIPQLHDNKEIELPDNLLLEDVECAEEDETENEVSYTPTADYTPTAEEIAAVLAYIKSQTVAEILLEGHGIIAEPTDSFTLPEEPAKSLFVKVYDVVDTITGTSIRPEDNGALTLSGRVTDADLDAAGVDKAWLLRIGAIVEAGYAGG